MTDEIITEVRVIKDEIAAQYNYSFQDRFIAIKKGEAELAAKGMRLIYPPNNAVMTPATALQRGKLKTHKIFQKLSASQ